MGKPKKIESPEILFNHFLDYEKQTQDSPRFKNELDKFGNIIPVPHRVPLTIEGFENYLARNGIINDLGDYLKNKDNRYDDYAPICTRVKAIIRQDQIEGGMVGQYNTSITQRLNNLSESTKTEISGGLTVPNLPDIGNR